MSENTLKTLEDAGIPIDSVSEEERAVLETLSPEEANVLASVHQKLAAVHEVEGQAVVGVVVF